ncbi:hypothetical protein H4219_000975 [Mycoemilia scoparia]|uniref:RING-type E3 ubiquitin transferase n=1 Tax=Mycoemilia scoparia TaxID=417184 RepID=A0A9W8A1L3_9FUNG|nr:hypothetical protein H4219_000975 [Mycoemilia scoparia]
MPSVSNSLDIATGAFFPKAYLSICRVCRCESTPEEPLFYPCKCTGSIRYVHQDCLHEWLQRSNKKHCELCGHEFTLRILTISCLWLFIFPTIVVWIKKFYFWSARSMVNGMSGSPSQNYMETEKLKQQITLELARSSGTSADISYSLPGIFSEKIADTAITLSVYLLNPLMKMYFSQEQIGMVKQQLSSFFDQCFDGIFITIASLLASIGITLLRDWVVNNEVLINEDEDEEEVAREPIIPGHQDVQVQPPVFNPVRQETERVHVENVPPDNNRDQKLPETDYDENGVNDGNDYTDDHKGKAVDRPDDYDVGQPVHHTVGTSQGTSITTNWDDNHLNHEYDANDEEGNEEDNHVEQEQQIREVPPDFNNQQNQDQEPEQVQNQALRVMIADDDDLPAVPFDDNAFEGGGAENIMAIFGFEGPLSVVFQYFILAISITSVILAGCIWAPYIVGKLLITYNAPNAFGAILGLLLYILDFFSDVVADMFTLLWKGLKPISSIIMGISQPALGRLLSIYISDINPNDFSKGLYEQLRESKHLQVYLERLSHSDNFSFIPKILSFVDNSALALNTPDSTTKNAPLGASGILYKTLELIGIPLDYISLKGLEIKYLDTLFSRTTIIVFGNVAILAVFLAYIKLARNRRSSFFKTVELSLSMVKIVVFMLLELVVFPSMCGALFGVSTLPLFPESTIRSRAKFGFANPFIATCLYWFVGTIFMFFFASFVSSCRTILRRGVMWFIRDPSDPHFHPVQDIYERSAFSQIKKLGISALMYSSIITLGFGFVFWGLSVGYQDIPLLKWEPLSSLPHSSPPPAIESTMPKAASPSTTMDSLSSSLISVPYDLIILHFILPPVVALLKPKDICRAAFRAWWGWTTSRLRLSYYFLGKLHLSEMGYWQRKSWRSWLKVPPSDTVDAVIDAEDPEQAEAALIRIPFNETLDALQEKIDGALADNADFEFKLDAQLWRVPNIDSIPVIPGRKMLIPLDTYGNPVNPAHDYEKVDRNKSHWGNNEQARQNHGRTQAQIFRRKDYKIIAIPPKFRNRLIAFAFWAWFSHSFVLTTIILVPMKVGRSIYSAIGKQWDHDIYPMFLGICISMLAISLVLYLYKAIDTIRNEDSGWTLFWDKAAELSKKAAKVSYLVLLFGGVVPLMLGYVLELHVIQTYRIFVTKSYQAPIQNSIALVPLIHNWALSLVWIKIATKLMQLYPDSYLGQKMQNIFDGPAENWKLWEATKVFAIPVLSTLLGLVTTPHVFQHAYCLFSQTYTQSASEICANPNMLVWAYPLTLSMLITCAAVYKGHQVYSRWALAIRDRNYLVGRELRNFSEDGSGAATSRRSSITTASDGS